MPITEEQARNLVSGNYGRASLEHIASYGIPFFVVKKGRISPRNLEASRHLLANGTAFVVDLGQGPFAITANHVVEHALNSSVAMRGLFPKTFELPALPLVNMTDLEQRLIARDEKKDIATFRLTREEVATLNVSTLTSAPNAPAEGTGGIAFVGYPGVQRDIRTIQQGVDGPEMTLCWATFPGFGVAASVNHRQITFQFERTEVAEPPAGFRTPDPDFDLGGMSGGPMLMKCETQSGIEYWVPAGVITQGQMSSNMNGGFLFASRLDGLQADGRF